MHGKTSAQQNARWNGSSGPSDRYQTEGVLRSPSLATNRPPHRTVGPPIWPFRCLAGSRVIGAQIDRDRRPSESGRPRERGPNSRHPLPIATNRQPHRATVASKGRWTAYTTALLIRRPVEVRGHNRRRSPPERGGRLGSTPQHLRPTPTSITHHARERPHGSAALGLRGYRARVPPPLNCTVIHRGTRLRSIHLEQTSWRPSHLV